MSAHHFSRAGLPQTAKQLAAGLISSLAFAGLGPAGADDGAPAFSSGEVFAQKDGAALYRATCQGCHMPRGEGAKGAGVYPRLSGNPRLASGSYVVHTVLHGRNGMPPFTEMMSDDQVAQVVNYVRSELGNHTDTVTAADVAKLR